MTERLIRRRFSKRRVNESQAHVLPEIIHCINDAERIADLGMIIFAKSDAVRTANGLTKDACDKVAAFKSDLKEFFASTMAALQGDAAAAASQVRSAAARIDGSVEDALKLGFAGIQIIGETVAVDYVRVAFAVRDVARHLENIAVRAQCLV
jgi:hypothetical protein